MTGQAIPHRHCLLAQMGPEAVFLHAYPSICILHSPLERCWVDQRDSLAKRSEAFQLFEILIFCICLCFLFFLSFSCPCSPCINMSRYVVQTEELPGYQLCRIPLLDTSSFQRCFKALSFYCLHATSMTAAASGALSGKWECAQLWRANLPSGTVCETKVSIMWEKWPGYVSMVGFLLVEDSLPRVSG